MKTFQPNCTLPPPNPTFVSGPNVRSTLDIVWSCLTVIILATWSILHLKVPPQIRSRTRRERLLKAAWLTWRKLKWMLWGLVAPEVLLAFALDRLWSAKESVAEMASFAREDGLEWTLTHGFFADMGGFVVKFHPVTVWDEAKQMFREMTMPELRQPEENEAPQAATAPAFSPAVGDVPTPSRPASLRQYILSCRHAQARRFRRLGSLDWELHPLNCATAVKILHCDEYDDNESRENLLRLCGQIWVLNARQLLLARHYGILSSLPSTSADELQDRSKSDGLVKVLAILQLAWLLIQLIVRAATSKPISQFEIMTLSYALCAAVTYVFLWSHPKDVSQPIVLKGSRFASPEEMAVIRDAAPNAVFYPSPGSHYALSNNTRSLRSSKSFDGFLSAMFLGAALFGSVHLIAWNFDFPTTVERLLWRVSSMILAASALFLLAVGMGLRYFHALKILESRLGTGMAFVSLLTPVARLFLLVETFRCLYFMEPGAYSSTWTVSTPHLG